MPAPAPNRLLHAASPYLLQHAYNPVDWFPWSPEALQKAAEENKLIIISIGYAACHWCHVMEHESFEDGDVAGLMNAAYVSVKVDREERPDVDQLYMNAAYLTTGRGGWPLNVIALPDGSPVYAGTYFPKTQWMQVLAHFDRLWQQQPESLIEVARRIREGIRQIDHEHWTGAPAPAMTAEDTDAMASVIHRQSDAQEGGLDKSPKFPMPSIWLFLLHHHYHTSNTTSLQLVKTTLDQMQRSGIYDQVGGGFARYSTDEYWMVPHFEKMLYDNAQLLHLYAEAYACTKEAAYLDTMVGIIRWMTGELRTGEGGFCSSLDADSEGEEGRYYTWYRQEIEELLGEDAAWFCAYYSVTEQGNWEGSNVLHNRVPAAEICRQYGIPAAEWKSKLHAALNRLAEYRSRRIRPALDDKQLAAWNALAVKGLVAAGMAAGREDWLDLAEETMAFIREAFGQKEDLLLRSYKDGLADIPAFLDDYACCIDSLICLYQARPREDYLVWAEQLMQICLEHFYDPDEKVFYYTDRRFSELIMRTKELSDNVIPASNSLMAACLLDLSIYTGRTEWAGLSAGLCHAILPAAARQPAYHAYWGTVFLQHIYGVKELRLEAETAHNLLPWRHRRFMPDTRLLHPFDGARLPGLQLDLPAGSAVICHRQTCSAPLRSGQEITEWLDALRGKT